MDALWLISEPARFFLVPEQHVIIDKQGELTTYATACEEELSQEQTLASLCAQVDIVILVGTETLFDEQHLAELPASLAKIGFLTEKTPASVRAQLSALGVDGYLTLGMQQQDVELVLNKTVEDKKAINDLQSQLTNYSSIAFTAMSSASEMGVVAIYAEKAQTAMSLAHLAQLTFSCLGDLDLEAVLQFSFEQEHLLFPVDTPETYRQLLKRATESSLRIISHGRFLLFSFDHLHLLVTNAPHENVERYGRMRDVLAYIVAIGEARAKTLKVNMMLKDQQENTRMVMTLLDMASRDNRNSIKEIMTNLSLALRTMATSLDLNLEQEKALLALADDAFYSLDTLQEATAAIEEYFRSLVEQLDGVAVLLETKPSSSAQAEASSASASASKVELF